MNQLTGLAIKLMENGIILQLTMITMKLAAIVVWARFSRKKTANGEIFDQNKISAAHRTLPLPSIVKVTNLENGKFLGQ